MGGLPCRGSSCSCCWQCGRGGGGGGSSSSSSSPLPTPRSTPTRRGPLARGSAPAATAHALGATPPSAAPCYLLLANVVRTLVATVVQVGGQATERALLVAQAPAALPAPHLRVCLRWLVACGVLGRSFSLLQDYPPPPSLFSREHSEGPGGGGGSGTAAATPPFLAALADRLGLSAPPTLAEAVALWEAAPFVGLGGAGAAAPVLPCSREGLVLALHCHHSASVCPIPGLITTYFAPGLVTSRLAELVHCLLTPTAGEGEGEGEREREEEEKEEEEEEEGGS